MTEEVSARDPEVHLLGDTEQREPESCPYCRSQLAGPGAKTDCPVCGAPHHGECWAANGGCAIYGCQAGPGRAMSHWPLPHEAGGQRWRRRADEGPVIRFHTPPALRREIFARLRIGATCSVLAVVAAIVLIATRGSLAALVIAAAGFPMAVIGVMEGVMVLDIVRSHHLDQPRALPRAVTCIVMSCLGVALMVLREAFQAG